MLGWLAAATAPLLIHLWSRHRFREVDWAALQFLLAAMRKNARRLQVQQWLLLAIRTLLVVLVVLAVAEPYGAGSLAGSAASAPAHKVLVVDASYSMGYREGAATRFDRARQFAADLVRNSSSADAFTVIAMADPARTILGREVIDPEAVASQILVTPLSHASADLSATLDQVTEALDRNANDPRGLNRQEVYFFTDLQRATWSPGASAEGGNDNTSFKDRCYALAKQAALIVVDVGTPGAANLAVTQVTTDEPFVTVGREVSLAATLRQFSDRPRKACVVELAVDDQSVGEQTVDVPAGGDANVHFTHRFSSLGGHALVLRAAGDELPIDNSRYLAFPVKERIQVLCVAGRDGAAKYVASALNPDPAANSAIEPLIVTEGDLEELDLTNFDCVFLCNVAQLTVGEAERLVRYAAAGGGVVFFLGDRVIADQYNALAHQPPNPQSETRNSKFLLPARLGPVATTSISGIDPLEYRHPIVAPFRGRERAGLITTPITRYFKLQLPTDRANADVAAALPSGDPLIVAAPLGRGRIMLVATDGSLSSADPGTGEPWTTWPTWPSFLPIVRELMAYASSGRLELTQQPVGTTLSGTLPQPSSGANDVKLQIVRPDGRTDSLSVDSTPEGLQWSYEKTDVSGIYTLRGAPANSMQQFAINVAASEGNLAKADPTSLPPELLIRDTWQNPHRASVAGLSPRSAWNLPLLWVALVLLFLESFLAWQFGRGAA